MSCVMRRRPCGSGMCACGFTHYVVCAALRWPLRSFWATSDAPPSLGIHKLDENATRKGSLHIFCEAEPTEHSIEVTGLGGDEQVRE